VYPQRPIMIMFLGAALALWLATEILLRRKK
jgi:hypothetical protein